MKSIVEEASSISKAIENAWIRAGKPTDFSIKIFEEAQQNMFGFTIQSAKIGLFFNGKVGVAITQPSPKEQQRLHHKGIRQSQQTTATQPKNKREAWPADMVAFSKNWIQQTLTIMGLPHMQFTVNISGNIAKFHFPNFITGKESSDRMLFSSFSHLMMNALRQKYKRSLHHMKVVLTSS